MADLFAVLKTVDRLEKMEKELAELRERAADREEIINYTVDLVWVFAYGKLPDRELRRYLTEHIINDFYTLWERPNAQPDQDVRNSPESELFRPTIIRG